MKKINKIISILISAIYLSCLNTIAFADESSTNEITQTIYKIKMPFHIP